MIFLQHCQCVKAGCFWLTPVQLIEEHCQLRAGNGYFTTTHRRPDKLTFFQAFGEQAQAISISSEDFTYVTNTSLMATYGGQFTLTFSPPIGYFYGNDNYHWRNCSFAAIMLVGLLCKSINTSKNSVAQFCMVLLLAPLLGVAGYIIYTGIELFSNAP